jgi:hypothetical protein
LRALVLETSFAVHGVDITVKRPAPDNDPIDTRGIWLRPLHQEAVPYGNLHKRDPHRILMIPRSDVPTMREGTLVEAPDEAGVDRRWRVETHDLTEADYWQLVLLPT